MSSRETRKEALARIAVEELEVDVFEHHGNDDVEHHSLSIQRLRRALEAAYRAGVAGGLSHLRLDSSASPEGQEGR